MGVKSCFFHEVMLFLWRRTTLLIILHKCPVILDAGFFGVLVPHKAIELRVVCGWFFVLCFFVGWCFFFIPAQSMCLKHLMRPFCCPSLWTCKKVFISSYCLEPMCNAFMLLL